MNSIAHLPLTWVFLTVSVYLFFAHFTLEKVKKVVHPAILAIAVLALILKLSSTSTDDYRRGGSVLSFFLGPSIVSLGLPLARLWPKIKENRKSIILASFIAAFVGIVSVVVVLNGFSADTELKRTLATKSVTSPIAIAIIEKNGGMPELAATVILFVGVLGSTLAKPIYRVLRIRSDGAKGFGLGAGAHGIGMATAVAAGDESGAMAAIALALVGLMTAILIPVLISIGFF